MSVCCLFLRGRASAAAATSKHIKTTGRILFIGITSSHLTIDLVTIDRMLLLCPVRGCHLALTREEKRVVCARGHSFDIARSGYINLLQPQERRSKNPGDTADAVAARRRLA